MKVSLPDDSRLDLPEQATGADAAAAIGAGLARAAMAVKVNGEIRDLARRLADGDTVEILTRRSEDSLTLIRHDGAHVLAAAVTELWPGTKVCIGPAIDSGFYYDFDFPEGVKITDADFDAIEQAMRRHVKASEDFVRRDVPVAEAEEMFATEGQSYKVELIRDLVRDQGVETVSIYQNGSFIDLCRGPHSPTTGSVKAFKLLSVAGAYWRGDEANAMLTRIYGTAFGSKAELDAHLERLELARKRDHRKLGKRLEMFVFRDEAPGMPFYLPNGMVVIREIEKAVRRQLEKRGYAEIKTPQMLDEEMWHRSGHFDNYRDNMYFTQAEDRRFAIKPMNCPGACLVYGSSRHSYRELPLRLAEFGLCIRKEREGVLHGLMRTRAFVQDDAHIYCSPDQVLAEVKDICRAIQELYSAFGFDGVDVELSTRPAKSIGSLEQWEQAESSLRSALGELGWDYRINEGDGAFYGPKIDFHITDALGRSWQCGTCQLDFFMPERFDLSYVGPDNAEHRPVMIHRALLGSMERFMGVLLEHHGGDLPVWLAPVQATVLSIADRHAPYADEVRSSLSAEGVRASVDTRSESIGRKIRDAELMRVPYILVVGDREAEYGAVAVRSRNDPDMGDLSLQDAVDVIAAEIEPS